MTMPGRELEGGQKQGDDVGQGIVHIKFTPVGDGEYGLPADSPVLASPRTDLQVRLQLRRLPYQI